jgi:hypothetical protein
VPGPDCPQKLRNMGKILVLAAKVAYTQDF